MAAPKTDLLADMPTIDNTIAPNPKHKQALADAITKKARELGLVPGPVYEMMLCVVFRSRVVGDSYTGALCVCYPTKSDGTVYRLDALTDGDETWCHAMDVGPRHWYSKKVDMGVREDACHVANCRLEMYLHAKAAAIEFNHACVMHKREWMQQQAANRSPK